MPLNMDSTKAKALLHPKLIPQGLREFSAYAECSVHTWDGVTFEASFPMSLRIRLISHEHFVFSRGRIISLLVDK